ncbi:phosphatase PAP2 family protein [Agrococcus terreus]|uniref:phosphatase PAP2 family protein n=1 Tax=Agrococcus terreus TaxID=574649 RepID=UPI00384BD5CA
MRPSVAARAGRSRRVAAAVVAGAAVLVVYALAVHTGGGRALDGAVLDAAGYATDSPLLTAVSVASLLLACALVATIALARRRGDLAIVGVAIIVGGSVVGRLLKLVLPRPEEAGGANSFPSGHMIAFAGVAVALLVVLPAVARPFAAIAAALVLPAVAVQLVRDGWHRPSDVLGSLLLVLAATAAATAWRAPHAPARARFHRLAETGLMAAALVAAAVAGIAHGFAPEGDARGGWTLVAGAAALVALVEAFLAAILRLLRLAPGRDAARRRGAARRRHALPETT